MLPTAEPGILGDMDPDRENYADNSPGWVDTERGALLVVLGLVALGQFGVIASLGLLTYLLR